MKLIKAILSVFAAMNIAKAAEPKKPNMDVPKVSKMSIIKAAPELELPKLKVKFTQPKTVIKTPIYLEKKKTIRTICIRPPIITYEEPKDFKAGEVCYRSTPNWRKENGLRKCPLGYHCRPKQQPKPEIIVIRIKDPKTGKDVVITRRTNPLSISGGASTCQKKELKIKLPNKEIFKFAKKGDVCYRPVPNWEPRFCEPGTICAHKPIKPGELRMSGEASYCLSPKEKKVLTFYFPGERCLGVKFQLGQINKICPAGYECGWKKNKKEGPAKCIHIGHGAPTYFIPLNKRCFINSKIHCTPGTMCRTSGRKGDKETYCLPQMFVEYKEHIFKEPKKLIKLETKSVTTAKSWRKLPTMFKNSKKTTKKTTKKKN